VFPRTSIFLMKMLSLDGGVTSGDSWVGRVCSTGSRGNVGVSPGRGRGDSEGLGMVCSTVSGAVGGMLTPGGGVD
jgi:hypothetical protein